jgi:alanine racemase
MRISLRHVADRVGVSEATVSRVLNDKPGVSGPTRASVLRALSELGYSPPALRRGPQVGMVGLVVPELDNPIFPALAQAIQTRLAGQGYVSVLCCATREGVQETDYLDMLAERNVAGIIVVSGLHADTTADHGLYRTLEEQGRPVVLVNGPPVGVNAPVVSCDDAHAIRLAVNHLASLGHRSIALITGPRHYVPVQRKVRAFTDAVAALDSDEPHVVETVFTVEGGHAATRRLLGTGVTAIIAASDLMALGAIRAIREAGGSVPHDVSVVGFDDTALMAFTDPPLTTVRQPVLAMADHATQLLVDHVAGKPTPHVEYLVRPELVVRSSTAPAARAAAHAH